MHKILTIFTIIFFLLNMCKSQNLELTLKQSFERANSLKLPLLVVRYDQEMVDYPKKYDSSTSDSILDSLMNDFTNKSIFETEFVVYKLDSKSSKEEDIAFQKQFIVDYNTPNFVLYSSNGELLHFYNPISYESKNVNIIQNLKDSLIVKKKLLLTRHSLEMKFLEKNIDKEELYELIKIRHSVHLITTKEINEYVRLNKSIDLDLMEIINQQTFKMSDQITKLLIEMDENNQIYCPFNLLIFFGKICEKALTEKDVKEFEQAQKWKNYYEKKSIEEMNKTFPGNLFYNSSSNNFITKNNLIDRFYFYKSNNDLINIIIVGNELANNILIGYKSNRKEFIENELAKEDFIINGVLELNPTLDSTVLESIKFRVENKDKVLLELENQYDGTLANDLNTVARTFYEKINEKTEIKKALKWSEQSIKLNLTPAYMDTYAHLLFKLGHKKKALKYEQKALELAILEGNTKYIEDFQKEILRFQSNPN